jgi:hypothetical protein
MNDSRFPFTYSCDLIRSFVGAHLPRAEASRIRSGIADALGISDESLAETLANHYKANEAAINDKFVAQALRKIA